MLTPSKRLIEDIHVRYTEADYAAIVEAARKAEARTVGEWVRLVTVKAAKGGKDASSR